MNTKSNSFLASAQNLYARAFVLSVALVCSPAFAQFDKAKQSMSTFQTFLAGCAVIICTIAIMFTGFKMMFQHAKWQEVSNILIGGIMIGGAAGFAAWAVG